MNSSNSQKDMTLKGDLLPFYMIIGDQWATGEEQGKMNPEKMIWLEQGRNDVQL